MNTTQLLQLWQEMWQEGNWVPSWPDSLAGLSAVEAAWTPSALSCHSIWQEVVHVIFWRKVTLRLMAGGNSPTEEEITAQEFALPSVVTEEAWAEIAAALKETQDALAEKIEAVIADPAEHSLERVRCHLIHDAYHLGRITLLRGMQGTVPKF